MHAKRLAVVALVVVAALGAPGVGATTAAAAGDCAFPTTRTDATGTSVTVSADPETVVTLNPSAAQTMYEIDAWDEVIGVSTYADYLPGADEKTVVGTGTTDATVEQTIALDPDLVLAPNTIGDQTVADLRAAGLTVYRFEEANDLDDVVAKTRLTGELVGACESADSRADEMDRQLDVIEDAVADVDRPRVFYTFFGFTAGEDTFVHEIIETAGGDNIAADKAGINANGASTSGYFAASSSVVVAAQPEWFVLNSDEYDTASVPSGAGGIYEGTPAYQEGNAVLLDANEVSQPAPRLVNSILDLVRVLHPEAYEEGIQGRIAGDALDGERRVTATHLADGSVDMQAANLGRADRVRFDLGARANATADVRRVDVALATVNPTFALRLRYGGAHAPPNGTRALETMSLSGNGIRDGDVDHLTLRLAVNRSRLAGADPGTVTLYRSNGTGWVPLQTTRVNATAATPTADSNGTATAGSGGTATAGSGGTATAGSGGNATAGSGGNATAGNASSHLVYEARTTEFSTLLLAADEPTTNATARGTATPTAAPEPTPTQTAAATTATTPTGSATPTAGRAPGFGPSVAVASLLTLALALALGRGGRR